MVHDSAAPVLAEKHGRRSRCSVDHKYRAHARDILTGHKQRISAAWNRAHVMECGCNHRHQRTATRRPDQSRNNAGAGLDAANALAANLAQQDVTCGGVNCHLPRLVGPRYRAVLRVP